VLPLPSVAVEDGEPTEQGRARLALASWAAQRVGLPVQVSGESQAAERVVALLAEQGVAAEVGTGTTAGNDVALRWRMPEE
jgi:hypothetical protein